jgi:hypothetical protein
LCLFLRSASQFQPVAGIAATSDLFEQAALNQLSQDARQRTDFDPYLLSHQPPFSDTFKGIRTRRIPLKVIEARLGQFRFVPLCRCLWVRLAADFVSLIHSTRAIDNFGATTGAAHIIGRCHNSNEIPAWNR